MIWLKGEPDNNSFLFLLTDNNMWGSTLYNNLRLCQEWCVRRQMVTCVSPSPPLKTKSRRGTPILFEERGGCIQAHELVKISCLPFREVYFEKSITRLTCHFPRPFFPSLSGLHQLPPCINVPNKIKIVSGAIREVKHCLYGNRETAGCRVKFYPACSFLMNVKARPATKEKRVFRKRDP